MLNKIELMGRLTRDPELRYTTTQKPVCTFSLACERDYQAGGSERVTDFVSCVAWNAGSEFISRNFRKGQMMAVTGRLQSRKWQDRDGNNRTEWEIVVENEYFCGDRPAEKKQKYGQAFEELSDSDGELPL